MRRVRLGRLLLLLNCLHIISFVVGSGERMFIVKIEVNGINSNCAGTIITNRLILTAAHCVNKQNVTVLQYNENAVHKYQVEAIFIHPNFQEFTLFNDVALVKITTEFREPWKPIILNDAILRNSLQTYENCNMVGWIQNNKPSSNVKNKRVRFNETIQKLFFEDDSLMLIRVPVCLITGTECSRKIKAFGGNFTGDEKFCGLSIEGQKDSWCSIGAGGPLLCSSRTVQLNTNALDKNPMDVIRKLEYEKVKYLGVNDTLGDPVDLLANFNSKRSIDNTDWEYQMGIVSWGKICSKVPGVFVRTDSYYDWMKSTIATMDNSTKIIHVYTEIFGTTNESVRYYHVTFQFSFTILLILLQTCCEQYSLS